MTFRSGNQVDGAGRTPSLGVPGALVEKTAGAAPPSTRGPAAGAPDLAGVRVGSSFGE
jgi:hypothetical protein